jgi:hypothetical protein
LDQQAANNASSPKMNRISQLLIILVVVLSVAGCATRPSEQNAKPPKHANRVKLLMYDSSPRNVLEHIDVFDGTHPIQRPCRDIALLTCEGRPNEELVATEALIYRARMMGADAVLILPWYKYQKNLSAVGTMFRAKAMVYESPGK